MKQQIKDEFRDQLGLSQIESLRKSLKCREGLLIDYDYAAELVPSQKSPGEDGGMTTDDPSATANVSGVRTVSLF